MSKDTPPIKPKGPTPRSSSEGKEPTLFAHEEPLSSEPRHGTEHHQHDPQEVLEVDGDLQQKLALLEPDDAVVPSSRQALAAFRKAHYQPQQPQKPQKPQAIRLPWHKRLSLWLGLDHQTQGLLWVGGAAAVMVVMFLFPLAQESFVTPEGSMERRSPPRTIPGSIRKAPATHGLYLGKGQVQWKMLYAPSHGQPGGAVPAQPTQVVGQQQRLAPGDLVQFVYQLPQAAHLMILNIDHKGTISACTPFQGRSSTLVEAGKGTLPKGGSMELDQSMGYERFVVVFANTAFSLAQVQKAFRVVWQRAGGDLRKVDQIPGPWSVRSYLIYKQVRPRRRASP